MHNQFYDKTIFKLHLEAVRHTTVL